MTRNDLRCGERLMSIVLVTCATKIDNFITKNQHFVERGEQHKNITECKQRSFIQPTSDQNKLQN
jgi:hypothetical protein